ncbi:MBL fold metallo-hydrolase [Halopenitus sp. POP-27]|uniref:MBL fold metallo-hydrolase n=1 Tax=Halopenitus sp. POP-27 TaxID=2994425 RepID=UPI002469BF9C|nr:MBL fold metallo-hydrolase [Halopenitus sp. POP-27]
MRLTVLGSGSAMAVPDRAQTGLLLETGDRALLVDCGSGVLGRLAGTDVGYEGVGTVLLTHHHLDHVSDLLALLKARWLAGEDHLEVLGPPGTKSLLDGLLDVHDYLDGRVDLGVREVTADGEFSAGGFDVAATETRHSMPGHAYRFAPTDSAVTARNGPVVFSGDTEAFAGVARFADGATVLLHDCSFTDDVDDETSNHPTPTRLGETLADVDVGRLYLTHLYPQTRGHEDEMTAAVAAAGFDGAVETARDGLRLDVPVEAAGDAAGGADGDAAGGADGDGDANGGSK